MSQEFSIDHVENFQEALKRDVISSSLNDMPCTDSTEISVNDIQASVAVNTEIYAKGDWNSSSQNERSNVLEKRDNYNQNSLKVSEEDSPIEEAIICKEPAETYEAMPARSSPLKSNQTSESSTQESDSPMPARSPSKIENFSLNAHSKALDQTEVEMKTEHSESILPSVDTIGSLEDESVKPEESNRAKIFSPVSQSEDSELNSKAEKSSEDHSTSELKSALNTQHEEQKETLKNGVEVSARSEQKVDGHTVSLDTKGPARHSQPDNLSSDKDDLISKSIHSQSNDLSCDTEELIHKAQDTSEDISTTEITNVAQDTVKDISTTETKLDTSNVSSDEPLNPETVKENDVKDECLENNNVLNEKSIEDSEKSAEDEYIDILGNNLLKKKVLKAGNGQETRPLHGQEVTVRVEGRLSDGKVIDKHDTLKFCVGDGDVVQALEICVCLMEYGEECELITDAKYAYGTLGLEPDIPGNETITYNLELLKVNPALDINELSFEERIKYGEKKRERGNFLFQRNEYTGAITSYTKALKILSVENLGSAEASKLQEVLESRMKCHNNMGACQLKVEAYDAAIKSCSEVLKSKPQNVKALYRIGLAYAAKGETKEAAKYLRKASLIEPESKIVNQELAKLSRKLKKENESAKDMYRKMLGTPPPPPIPPSDQGIKWWKLLGFGGAVLAVLVSIGAASYRYSQH